MTAYYHFDSILSICYGIMGSNFINRFSFIQFAAILSHVVLLLLVVASREVYLPFKRGGLHPSYFRMCEKYCTVSDVGQEKGETV
jgi:hypothetical protein